jgi:hypothetical protein
MLGGLQAPARNRRQLSLHPVLVTSGRFRRRRDGRRPRTMFSFVVSTADVGVRYAPGSGAKTDIAACPSWANSGNDVCRRKAYSPFRALDELRSRTH